MKIQGQKIQLKTIKHFRWVLGDVTEGKRRDKTDHKTNDLWVPVKNMQETDTLYLKIKMCERMRFLSTIWGEKKQETEK